MERTPNTLHVNGEAALTPAKTTIKGELKLDCKQRVEVTGMDDNLT